MCWGICLAGICPGPGEMSGFQAAAILFVRASVSPTNTFVHYVEIDVVYLSSNIQPSNGQPIYRYDIKIKYIPEIRPSSSGTLPSESTGLKDFLPRDCSLSRLHCAALVVVSK